jgi:hypothetical protein
MSYYLRPIGKYIVLIACFGAGALLSPALAREETSLLLNQPARSTDEQPAPPPQQEQAAEEVMPAPAMPNGAAHPAPPIKYHASRSARRVLRGGESIELLMVARNPADSCLYEIPLCLPACCVGEPTVVERSGLRGRGVVEYCWPCGFSATVKFRHSLGDVKVEYDGD